FFAAQITASVIPFSWALPTPGLRNKLGFSGNTINAEGIRGRQERNSFSSTPVFLLQVCCQSLVILKNQLVQHLIPVLISLRQLFCFIYARMHHHIFKSYMYLISNI